MCDKNLILVKTIKKHPCLYNHQLTEYSRRDITDKAWNEVANETKQTVSDCKEKWKNLRYSFLRSLRPNADGTSKKKYYLNDDMEFILPYLRVLAPKSSGSGTHLLDYDSEEENIDINQDMSLPLHLQNGEMTEINYVAEPPKKKAKYSDTGTFTSNQYLRTTGNSQSYDEDSRRMFLLSLLPEVAELTETQMRKFRRKVLQLLDDISDLKNDESVSIWAAHNLDVPENNLIKGEP